MKTIDLEPHIQKAAKHNRKIWTPGSRTNRTWPICLTCGTEVDAAELKNVNSRSCEIVGRCHGKEDSIKVTWKVPVAAVGADVLEDVNVGWAIKRAMADCCFFGPEHTENTTGRIILAR